MTRLIILYFLILLPLSGIGQSKYQLIIQNINNCAEQKSIDTTFNWYSVVLTDSGEYLMRINPILKKSENIQENSGPFDLNIPYSKSLFILGTNKKLDESLVSRNGTDYYKKQHNFYPGQLTTLYLQSKDPNRQSWDLQGYGCVDYGKPFDDYQLILKERSLNGKHKDIIPELDFLGESGMPNLKWFGDIDGDHKPDLLLSCSSNSRNQYTLFLSTESEEFVKKIATYEMGNCY